MVRELPDGPLSEPEKCLLIPKIVIESSEDAAMVVGTSSFEKYRLGANRSFGLQDC